MELRNLPDIDKDLVFFHYIPQSSLFSGYISKIAHVHFVVFDTGAEEQEYAKSLQN